MFLSCEGFLLLFGFSLALISHVETGGVGSRSAGTFAPRRRVDEAKFTKISEQKFTSIPLSHALKAVARIVR